MSILAGLDASFNLNLLTLLPPIVVLVLVLMKKPADSYVWSGNCCRFYYRYCDAGCESDRNA